MVIARSSNLLGKVTIFFVICCLVMVGLCVNTAVALDGAGTQEDPWLIQSLEDFNDFAADANYWDDYTRLETDVNLAGIVYDRAVIAPDVNTSVLFNFHDGPRFSGVFDGNNHKILNLTIDDGGAGNSYLGLFGYVDDGEVRNLGLEGGSVSGNWEVGGLVGWNTGVVTVCYFTGSVNGNSIVGGLVGEGEGGSISECYSAGEVIGRDALSIRVGGLVGVGGDVSDSHSYCHVDGFTWVGGLVGFNYGGNILNCYSTGNVTGGDAVGGLVGYMGYGYCSVSNCYSTGDVNGHSSVGGLMGYIFEGNVWNCYSTGDVNGIDEVGGLAGYNNWGEVWDCFWDIDTQTHGVTESIGDYYWGTITNVLGLPTNLMQTRSTFTDADWDFINTWNIGENQTYPYLRVYLPSDINKDRIVNFLDIAITANQWMEEK